jgi:hypothetical protein
MRARVREQAEARRLRRQGRSLREIARALTVSVGSVSAWVRDVPRGGVGVASPPDPAPDACYSEEAEGCCGRCRRVLPESSFSRHPKGRQWWCKECFREYFRQRGDHHRRQSATSRRKRQAIARRFIREHLRTHPCVECGEADPTVLEFDHLREKLKEISLLAAGGASVKALKREIAKCEVVCCNCHRRRTARRGNWRRASSVWWKTPPPGDHLQSRNIAFAYSYLEHHPCVECGCADLCVLEFDHVGKKTGAVLKLARNGVGLARLEQEIANCQVRCANCHRRRTADRRASAA